MNIIGGKLAKVTVEKFSDVPQQVALGMNMNIQDLQLRGRMLVLKYEYEIEYKAKVAKMLFSGEVHLQDSEKAMKDVEEGWKKSKQLSPELTEQVLNSVTYTATAVGSMLSFAVGVPAPILNQRLKLNEKGGKAG